MKSNFRQFRFGLNDSGNRLIDSQNVCGCKQVTETHLPSSPRSSSRTKRTLEFRVITKTRYFAVSHRAEGSDRCFLLVKSTSSVCVPFFPLFFLASLPYYSPQFYLLTDIDMLSSTCVFKKNLFLLAGVVCARVCSLCFDKPWPRNRCCVCMCVGVLKAIDWLTVRRRSHTNGVGVARKRSALCWCPSFIVFVCCGGSWPTL